MDNIRLVADYMKEVAAYAPAEDQGKLIHDPEKNHFLLYSIHWTEKNDRHCYLHIEVKPDGKVWIQHDGTDLSVADALVDRGIPKNQIVLGFRSPFYRKMSDFALQ